MWSFIDYAIPVQYTKLSRSVAARAVQRDAGHTQISLITEWYAHILDDDRRINAEKFEEMFYQENGDSKDNGNTAELLALMKKLQESPDLLQLLNGLVK